MGCEASLSSRANSRARFVSLRPCRVHSAVIDRAVQSDYLRSNIRPYDTKGSPGYLLADARRISFGNDKLRFRHQGSRGIRQAHLN